MLIRKVIHEQHFLVVLFIMLYKVVVKFDSVYEVLHHRITWDSSVHRPSE